MLMVYNRLQKELSACLFAIRLYNLAYLGPVCFLLGLYNSVLDYIVLVFAFFLLLGSGSLLSYSLLALFVFSLFPVSSCWRGVYQTMFASLLMHWQSTCHFHQKKSTRLYTITKTRPFNTRLYNPNYIIWVRVWQPRILELRFSPLGARR
jgi:hypothetical protein